MQLYFNGDSFVAGVELGDDILPEYPGLTTYPYDESSKNKAKDWLKKTYDPNHHFSHLRNTQSVKIQELEFQRAFPNRVAELTGLKVVNHALGGSSMDRIVRTSITDLHNIRKNSSEKIVAFIGTTYPARWELAHWSTEHGLYTDYHGYPKDWVCMSTSYLQDDFTSEIESLIRYKVMYEKNYHHLMNFYKNILLLTNFCKINNIVLHYVATHDNIIKDFLPEKTFNNRIDLLAFQQSAAFQYTFTMTDYFQYFVDQKIVCPGGHFGEGIHKMIADDIVKIIGDL